MKWNSHSLILGKSSKLKQFPKKLHNKSKKKIKEKKPMKNQSLFIKKINFFFYRKPFTIDDIPPIDRVPVIGWYLIFII